MSHLPTPLGSSPAPTSSRDPGPSAQARRTASRDSPDSGPTRRTPYFGIEIEVFVKLKPETEKWILGERSSGKRLPKYWEKWDIELENNETDSEAAAEKQRECVGEAITELIKNELGENHGWICKPDGTLNEELLGGWPGPEGPSKWWGIEVVSPPIAASEDWQTQLHRVFTAMSRDFEFWTNEDCSCHVHISPGPDSRSRYTMGQLVRVAKGAYLWENALCGLLPKERRENRYAWPNREAYGEVEYDLVRTEGWKPLFNCLTNLGCGAMEKFIRELEGNRFKCLSTDFASLNRYGTVEFRRQAGVASATTAIRRVLLALGLHVSALHYDFGEASSRMSYPTTQELIVELDNSVRSYLPTTCRDPGFVNWLNECAKDSGYGDGRMEIIKINHDEEKLHNKAQARQQSRSMDQSRQQARPQPSRIPTRATPRQQGQPQQPGPQQQPTPQKQAPPQQQAKPQPWPSRIPIPSQTMKPTVAPVKPAPESRTPAPSRSVKPAVTSATPAPGSQTSIPNRGVKATVPPIKPVAESRTPVSSRGATPTGTSTTPPRSYTPRSRGSTSSCSSPADGRHTPGSRS